MSWHRCSGLAAGVVFAVAASLHAQATTGLDEKVLSANRELDRQLLEAHVDVQEHGTPSFQKHSPPGSPLRDGLRV